MPIELTYRQINSPFTGEDWVILNFQSPLAMSVDDFYYFGCQNQHLLLERNPDGSVLILPRHGGTNSIRNVDIACQLRCWSKDRKIGVAFGSGTPFQLPNGAVRRPNASLLSLDRWNSLTKDQREKFAPFCPDFVIELRSESDRLIDLQHKLEEFIANGAQLGWIIDPFTKTVHIYRPGQPAEVLANPATVSGESVLPGFELDLKEILTN